MLDIWMSSIARAGGVETRLVRAEPEVEVERVTPRPSLLRRACGKALLLAGEGLHRLGARVAGAGPRSASLPV